MKYIVYQVTNVINNKIYIGVHQTKNPDIFDGYIGGGIRVNSPSSYAKPNSPYQYAVKKYGPKNFKRTVLKIFDNYIDAYNMEAEIVDKDFIKREDTYNAQLGGFSGGFRINITYQFNSDGDLIKEWDTVMEASEFYGKSHTSILNAIKFKQASCGFYWSYDKKINIEEYSKMNKGTVCYVYSSDTGKYIDRYDSVPEASKNTGCRKQDIQRALRGGYRVNNYYFSTKLMEEFQKAPRISIKNKSVYVYNLDGDFIFESKTVSELKEYLNIKTVNPVTVSLRTNRPYKTWQFSLEKVNSMPKVINNKNISKKVGRFSMDKNLLEIFDSITAAVNIYGTGVQRVLKGQQSHCKGFIFEFITD